MISLDNGLKLYHGSYCEVRQPLLEMCSKYKDFGRGFYLTSSYEQAHSFVKASIKKATLTGAVEADRLYGFVSVYELCLRNALSVYCFDEADRSWLEYVTSFRRPDPSQDLSKKMVQYDVVIGKVADDATNAALAAYMAGAYGIPGSPEAETVCISQLRTDRLTDQLCFRTVDALECLSFTGSEKIWIQ